ncbi:unnamed protein product [Amoebophrya sp. A120]|nr:unnamed protein product [Amoebophrya sp. A120]|eukprot:GSA120T00022263001.1
MPGTEENPHLQDLVSPHSLVPKRHRLYTAEEWEEAKKETGCDSDDLSAYLSELDCYSDEEAEEQHDSAVDSQLIRDILEAQGPDLEWPVDDDDDQYFCEQCGEDPRKRYGGPEFLLCDPELPCRCYRKLCFDCGRSVKMNHCFICGQDDNNKDCGGSCTKCEKLLKNPKQVCRMGEDCPLIQKILYEELCVDDIQCLCRTCFEREFSLHFKHDCYITLKEEEELKLCYEVGDDTTPRFAGEKFFQPCGHARCSLYKKDQCPRSSCEEQAILADLDTLERAGVKSQTFADFVKRQKVKK